MNIAKTEIARPFLRLATLFAVALLSGCSAPESGVTSEDERFTLREEARLDLTRGHCDKALDKLGPLVHSKYSDNESRLLWSSAHACNLGFKFYEKFQTITERGLGGTQFWTTLTEAFPSSVTDTALPSAQFAMDALLAMIKPGSVTAVEDQILNDPFNPGSIWPRDRAIEGNSYLIFMAMANVGVAQNRYGFRTGDIPSATNFKRTRDLPWTTGASLNADSSTANAGCAYISGVLNIFDAIGATATTMGEDIGGVLNEAVNTIQSGIDIACTQGCLGNLPTGCSFTAAECTGCFQKMRDRHSCAQDLKVSCAAAGVVQFIHSVGGWECASGTCTP